MTAATEKVGRWSTGRSIANLGPSASDRRDIAPTAACIFSLIWRGRYVLILLLVLMTYSSLIDKTKTSNVFRRLEFVYTSKEPHTEIVLARILSNSLPPLHSPVQTTVNLKVILTKEVLPASFSRYWVVSCVLNSTERTAIISLLEAHGEKFHEIPLVKSSDVRKMEQEAFNTNRARNMAIRGAFSTFNPKWVLIWDGCQFMTNESAAAIQTLIEGLNGTSVFYTPMYRLIHNINITHDMKFDKLYHHLSPLMEALLGMNRRFVDTASSNGRGPFNESIAYGDGNKRWFLAALNASGVNVGCPEAYHDWGLKEKRGHKTEMELASKCGFALRLLYHPENKEYNQHHTIFNGMDKRREGMRRFRVALENYADDSTNQQ